MIIGIIVLLLVTFIAIYFLFFRKSPSEPTGTGPTLGEASGEREGVPIERDNDRRNNTGVFSPVARLRLISEESVAGATTIETDEEAEVVRLLERKTAHVFDVDLDSLEQARISNTTIPRIYEALWTAEGRGVILRYLTENNQTIKTYFANLEPKDRELREGETPYDLSGDFLPDNITHLVLSPNKSKAFWLTETLRNSQGTISNPDGSSAEAIFRSDFREWLPQWFSDNTISMTTKASGVAPGFSYNMPVSNGSLDRNIGNIVGLTTLTSPDGKYILYSQSENQSIRTHIYNTESEESEQLLIRLLPEKCAWSDNSTLYCGVPNAIGGSLYPDTWYQGKILFTDSIFRVDAETNSARRVYSPHTDDGENLDIYKPFISESGKYMIFNNKGDMSLWAFTL